jgi:hypothetical protein
MNFATERHDFYDVEMDRDYPWVCSGCNREYGEMQRGPRMIVSEGQETHLYCDICVEDGKHLKAAS